MYLFFLYQIKPGMVLIVRLRYLYNDRACHIRGKAKGTYCWHYIGRKGRWDQDSEWLKHHTEYWFLLLLAGHDNSCLKRQKMKQKIKITIFLKIYNISSSKKLRVYRGLVCVCIYISKIIQSCKHINIFNTIFNHNL